MNIVCLRSLALPAPPHWNEHRVLALTGPSCSTSLKWTSCACAHWPFLLHLTEMNIVCLRSLALPAPSHWNEHRVFALTGPSCSTSLKLKPISWIRSRRWTSTLSLWLGDSVSHLMPSFVCLALLAYLRLLAHPFC